MAFVYTTTTLAFTYLSATFFQEFYRDKRKIDKIQLRHYLISLLFPVLKQLNRDQSMELEVEAMITGMLCTN